MNIREKLTDLLNKFRPEKQPDYTRMAFVWPTTQAIFNAVTEITKGDGIYTVIRGNRVYIIGYGTYKGVKLCKWEYESQWCEEIGYFSLGQQCLKAKLTANERFRPFVAPIFYNLTGAVALNLRLPYGGHP